MFEWLYGLPVVFVALGAGFFCWFATSFGALGVFFCHNLKPKYMAIMLAFSGGIMIASTFFSLIAPALEYCGGVAWKEVVFVIVGFLAGGTFIVLTSFLFDKKTSFCSLMAQNRKKSFLIATSITLHNIPEGMAVGVVVSGALVAGDFSMFVSALMLAFGIAIQNIPEGASVALALRSQGARCKKAFAVGAMSGVVEPIFACVASVITIYVLTVLPAFLAFSAGAMMLVAITELIPEALENDKFFAVTFFSLGFAVMALLDMLLS